VGGWPIDRFSLLHGPSNEGKTLLLLGLGLSFLKRGHFFAHVDAEYTTPAGWLVKLMGEHASSPLFRAMRPRTYEETVDAVRSFCEAIGEARERGEIEKETTGLIGIDSIRKLVPKALLEKLMKEGSDGDAEGKGRFKRRPGGVDGMGGRAGQIKAALNAAWVDELVPLLGQTGTAMVVITRETDDPDANGFGGRDFKLGGGKALVFDSSLVARIQRDKWICDDDGVLGGERHSVEIHKTKVEGKSEKLPEVFFHSSTGEHEGVPFGFDIARDLLELGEQSGVVKKAGSHYSFKGTRIGNGEMSAVRKLYADPALLEELSVAVRA
jgi:recombination protein RecA